MEIDNNVNNYESFFCFVLYLTKSSTFMLTGLGTCLCYKRQIVMNLFTHINIFYMCELQQMSLHVSISIWKNALLNYNIFMHAEAYTVIVAWRIHTNVYKFILLAWKESNVYFTNLIWRSVEINSINNVVNILS